MKGYLTKQDVSLALETIGLAKGATVLVHSNLFSLGFPKVESKNELLNLYYGALTDIITDTGTICVPAYFYEYGRYNLPYDVVRSPVSKSLGIFASYINVQEGAVRSYNPLTAIASLGAAADYISGAKTCFSYGVDSPWQRLHELNATILCMGVDETALTISHYIEYMAGVAHMYNKIYDTPVLYDGETVFKQVISCVRYLSYGVEYDLHRWGQDLRTNGIVSSQKCGDGHIYMCKAQDIFDFTIKKLHKNSYYLLKNEPQFIKGEIPKDGPTQ